MTQTVLIIENDTDTLDVLNEVVSGLPVNVVCRTETLELPKLKELKPSLILLDHWLNGELGGDYCKLIKKDPETSKIPVIMISAVTTLGAIADNALADGHLRKPFDINYLEELVKHYCGV
ncbi:MAG: two-component system response regulator [Sphingobacteriales bacterium]